MKQINIFLVILMVLLVQGNAQSLTDTSRFKYHGYFYKNENLEYKELEEIREFANMLVFSMVRFDSLDYFYFWDEPDLNHVPGPEVMEKYIAEFKSVFPAVKVTTCDAIINEESLDVVPPDSYDLLMVDPYVLMNEASEHAAADFERFYRSRLALSHKRRSPGAGNCERGYETYY